ncbi:HTH marR-type domain-containing protein [Flavobacterium longum]|uniref:MarR family winged helix-turn-helix transcriptional regulator n=1 Tax=Flavobacterium longum TaxID=1299340 RepID=UPI0039EC711B
MEKLKDITFYHMDKAIRTYRSYAQKRLRDNGFTITIDQWLVIKAILENPDITQQELAEKVFKDNASVTRIIALLVKSGYLERDLNPDDRRKTVLNVTVEGREVIAKVQTLVLQNRQVALNGIAQDELEILNKTLKIITENCS